MGLVVCKAVTWQLGMSAFSGRIGITSNIKSTMNYKQPKRTIASMKHHSKCCPQSQKNWARRNSSTNVSSVITDFEDCCADSDSETPRRLIRSQSPNPQHLTAFKIRCESPRCDGNKAVFKFTPKRQQYEHLCQDYFETTCKDVASNTDLDLTNFRDQNYFECHGGFSKAPSTVPSHRCSHKFTLDDKLRSKPQKVDEYGISRCSTCSKVISTRSLQYIPQCSDSNQSLKFLPPSSKSYKSSGTNTMSVCLQATDEDLIFDVCQDMIENEFSMPKLRKVARKRVPPVDSLALRFQKGVY
ncbi:PREDICTED: uncharacterized protein LOC108567624 [Nicrophorus vespilloides]|uniref:Uncharacterized protein LOC108567624 n=1 Tax=Nicrophorus vespilloides TaxID=110193 RepID=A0ABM1NA46_NICVS|nr:PREDICTED: uncharacterized protein LOC108567624 [Nicrophorus vespilloides]